MRATVFIHEKALGNLEIRDRFDFEDQVLNTLVPPRPCQEYREHRPSPQGVRVFSHPETHGFEARPYLEFEKYVQDATHFQVMQEGRPTGFTVVLRQ